MKTMAFILGLLLAAPAWATPLVENAIPTQGSTAAEGSHVFKALTLTTVGVTWQGATTARYLMIFDGTSLPVNGATTGCAANHSSGCLAWCQYMPNSTSAPNVQWYDWTTHPMRNIFGTVVAVSTGAGCGTLTVDGSNDYLYAQVQ